MGVICINGDRAKLLIEQFKKKAQLYRTDALLVPHGDDFRFIRNIEVHRQFDNLQRLIQYINLHPELHTTVSTTCICAFLVICILYRKFNRAIGILKCLLYVYYILVSATNIYANILLQEVRVHLRLIIIIRVFVFLASLV